jgi:hypothetical protein
MIIVKLFHCRTFQQHCHKFPEDGNRAEKCKGNLIVKNTTHNSAFVGAHTVGNSSLHSKHYDLPPASIYCHKLRRGNSDSILGLRLQVFIFKGVFSSSYCRPTGLSCRIRK